MSATTPDRLATYGTLSPGRSNHHELDGISGRWLTGHVHGDLLPDGWGAALGFPALVLDPAADPVPVHVLESADLPRHWDRLDEFEGEGYDRVLVTVHDTVDGDVTAWLYALRR